MKVLGGMLAAALIIGIAARLAVGAAAQNTEGQRTTASAAGSVAPKAQTSVRVDTPEPTRVSMRNVNFHVGDGVYLRIRSLEGSLRSGRGVVDFDDRTSYRLTIDTAEVGLTGADITNLLNRHVFAYRGAPLKNLKVEIRGTELRQSGILRKGVDIPFSMVASVSLTPDRRFRIHPTSIRIFGVNGTKLMNALGLSLQKMLNVSRAVGVSVEGNDLLLSPLIILPPPAIDGRIVRLEFTGDQLVQIFASTQSADRTITAMQPPDSAVRNYMFYRGGTLHFGKLFMTNAEMLVVDGNPADPFDFDNTAYQRQLIAGYSRTLPDLGLEVFMPDAGRSLGRSSTVGR